MKRTARNYCEPVRQLDIRVLQRKGVLKTGASVVVRWQVGGSARVEPTPHRVKLVYQLGGRLVDQPINVADSANGYGRRGWWGCPGCGRKCAKLYLDGRFSCRICAGLHYRSQSSSPRGRAFLRLQKIRSQLTDDFGELARPKWMRRAKFAALAVEAEGLEALLVSRHRDA